MLLIIFCCEKLFSLMLSHLFIFAFIVCVLLPIQKTIAKINAKELLSYIFF